MGHACQRRATLAALALAAAVMIALPTTAWSVEALVPMRDSCGANTDAIPTALEMTDGRRTRSRTRQQMVRIAIDPNAPHHPAGKTQPWQRVPHYPTPSSI